MVSSKRPEPDEKTIVGRQGRQKNRRGGGRWGVLTQKGDLEALNVKMWGGETDEEVS